MAKNFEHLIHKNSNVTINGKPKLPTSSQIEYGELAINYAKDNETISLKNSDNEIVTFSSDKAFEETEKAIAFSLNDLDARVREIISLPSVSASDNGKILMVVNGEWALVSPSTIYTGTGTPTSEQGNNGDIYLQTT